MRRTALAILAAAIVAAFVVSEAHAQASVIPQWIRNNVRVTVQQGADALPVNDQDRDRNFPQLTSVFTGVVLNPSTTYVTPNAIDMTKYTRGELQLNWAGAAAADSDTTFLMIRIYGKTAPNSGNYHLWTPLSATIQGPDTCQCNSAVADTAGAAKCLVPAPTFIVVRSITNYALLTKVVASQLGGGTATTRGTLRKIPGYAWRYAGWNGVSLDLSSNSGNPFPFAYMVVEITNLSFSRALTNMSCDLWPRVQ